MAGDFRTTLDPGPLRIGVAGHGLLRAKGLSWADKRAMARLMGQLKRQAYRVEPDRPVAALLAESGQTDTLSRLIWEPLCIAALNTPVSEASAQVFARVLQDSLAASASASDLLIPRVDLSELFPVPASRWLAMRGHQVRIFTARLDDRYGSGYVTSRLGPQRGVLLGLEQVGHRAPRIVSDGAARAVVPTRRGCVA